MAAVTYSPNEFQTVTVERVFTGTGQSRTENETHLHSYTLTNVHPTAIIRGWVEINNVIDRESGPLQPGQSWTADYGTPGLAIGGPNQRIGWGMQEV